MPSWPKKKWKQVLLVLLIVLVVTIPIAITYIGYINREPALRNGTAPSSIVLSSSAFENEEAIPVKYTAQGENVNPPLNFNGIPTGTASLVIIIDDPVLPPIFAWNHWVIWNIPPNASIDENTQVGVQGRNGWNRNEYGGPDPLFGTRSYVFKVYALDITLDISADSRKSDVLRAMDNHVLARAELVGRYAK